MGLAVIPTDWTEEYIDVCVKWPNSPEWLAILRGQLTGPYETSFWDKFTGDPEEAQTAIEATFDQNLHTEECMIIPTGTILEYAGLTEPSGFLFCFGQAVSRSTYAALFAVIGETFGVGNGTTTFNLPDRQGKVGVGFSSTDPTFNDVGNVGGSKTHTLTTPELASHNHVQNAHSHTQDGHNHTQNSHNHVQNAHSHNRNAGGLSENVQRGTVGGGTFGFTTGTRIIDAYTVTAEATPTNQVTTPTNISTVAGNQATTPTNQTAGSGNAHNNLQPYLVLDYIIKI